MKLANSIFRLNRVIDNKDHSKETRFGASVLLLEKAVANNNLELYERVRRQIEDKIIKMFPEDARPNIPANLDDLNWQKKVRATYESEVRTKNTELEGHVKNGLKDSIRLSLQDIAAVHIKFGFTGNAMTLWEKAYENSSAEEDLKHLCTLIIKTGFEAQNIFFLERFCQRGLFYVNQKNPEFGQFVTVMTFLSKLLNNQPLQACQVLY